MRVACGSPDLSASAPFSAKRLALQLDARAECAEVLLVVPSSASPPFWPLESRADMQRRPLRGETPMDEGVLLPRRCPDALAVPEINAPGGTKGSVCGGTCGTCNKEGSCVQLGVDWAADSAAR